MAVISNYDRGRDRDYTAPDHQLGFQPPHDEHKLRPHLLSWVCAILLLRWLLLDGQVGRPSSEQAGLANFQ